MNNDYIILTNFNDNIKLVKISFNYFINNYYSNLYFNRKINDNKVNELYYILTNNEYILPWTCHSLYDIKNNKKQILDGQHRYEAINKYRDIYKNINNNLFIYMWEYDIDDINNINSNKYVLELFKKLNNNSPLNDDDIPKNKIVEVLFKLKQNITLKNGIGIDDKFKSCHSPKIHEKELFELLNKHEYLFKSLSVDEIINNIIIINEKLKNLTPIELYKNKSFLSLKEKKILEKANIYNFYLGIKDSYYPPSFWIKYINNYNNLII